MTTFDINNLQGEFRTGKLVQEDGVIVTPVARLSYANLFKRTPYKGAPGAAVDPNAKETFNCNLIFNTGRTDQPGLVDPWTVFYAECTKIATQYFQNQGANLPYQYPMNFHDGRKSDKDGYGEGTYYVSVKNHDQNIANVPCVDGSRRQLGANDIKSGYFVRARVRPYISKAWSAKGINFSLLSVQLLLPWEEFGAQSDTGDEFDLVQTPGQAAMPVGGNDW